jgi:acyl-CoA synthetase (AMP-forming)/AMP-acid ligase II
VRIVIQDSSGNSVAPRRLGEICARSGSFMLEYLNRPEETASAFRDGWFRTGDVGYLDEEGYLFLVDRAKDMIVSGGENVYSTEVESAISTHPSVAQVAVIGIPDERWGEAVHAIVVCRPGEALTNVDVIAHARTSLAGYKVPKSVEIRSEALPLSGAMKILKRDLRAAHWKDHDRAIG